MPRKLALKRLTASDLTFFKWHFQYQPAGNQKAFNLDARILTGAMYPELGRPSTLRNPIYLLTLHLFGPGLVQPYTLARKILKQQKNWRLNGEQIDNPDDDPERYNILSPGDFALFEFSGNDKPEAVKINFVASGVAADTAIHRELARRYPSGSMWLLQETIIADVLAAAAPPAGHPLNGWIESDALEDAALGGATGTAAINRRSGGRGITPEDFIRSRQAAEQTGVTGENLLNTYLDYERSQGRISEFEWTASINAVAPFDFQVSPTPGETRAIDAKSTSGAFTNPLHLSLGEVQRAVHGPEPYDIYRLYEVTDDTAKMRIARDIGPQLRDILDQLSALPSGVTADGISVRPSVLNFDTEELFLASSYEEDAVQRQHI
ncbi:protein NO VEIN domain-containing protein [Parapusillimonas sp. JC17]|uniref:protein NO VEIN domain-containing protein n=1 Tax=Parapusillimonas sp. JC17 TaxID=3445768 RepID=UPI003FA0D122